MKKQEMYIERKLNFNISYDVVKRKIRDDITLYYLSSLADINLVNEVIKGFMIQNNQILNCSILKLENIDAAISSVNSGCLLLLHLDDLYIIETRNYPNRSISESESEKSMKGSHDSFTESILTNTALIRRRINDENFRCELYTIGKKSKTDVSLNYLDNKVNKKLLFNIKKKLKKIEVDFLTLQDKTLSELLFNQKFSVFPKVRFSERPDIASIHILKGYIVIIVDTSSSIILVPTTFFELNEQIEEYHLPVIIASFNKIFKLFCIFISLFLLPVWFIICIDKNPPNNYFLIIENITRKELFFQIITVSIFLNAIRLASLHTSSLLSTSMSLFSSIILSSLAVETGLVNPEVVFYASLSAICSYCISNYETSRAISFWNLVFIIMVGLFFKIGFIISFTLLFICLVTINSFGTFYLYPLIPFDIKKVLNIFFKKIEKSK